MGKSKKPNGEKKGRNSGNKKGSDVVAASRSRRRNRRKLTATGSQNFDMNNRKVLRASEEVMGRELDLNYAEHQLMLAEQKVLNAKRTGAFATLQTKQCEQLQLLNNAFVDELIADGDTYMASLKKLADLVGEPVVKAEVKTLTWEHEDKSGTRDEVKSEYPNKMGLFISSTKRLLWHAAQNREITLEALTLILDDRILYGRVCSSVCSSILLGVLSKDIDMLTATRDLLSSHATTKKTFLPKNFTKQINKLQRKLEGQNNEVSEESDDEIAELEAKLAAAKAAKAAKETANSASSNETADSADSNQAPAISAEDLSSNLVADEDETPTVAQAAVEEAVEIAEQGQAPSA